MVGDVRASNSDCPSATGLTRKKMVAVVTLNKVVIKKLFKDRFINSKSFNPTESPTPMIGPISGEMSMAPIITAVEFTFNPNEAMNMANIRIQRLAPLNSTQFIVLVFTQIKIVFQKSLDSEGISVVRIHDIYNLTIYYSVVYFFINQLMTGMLPRGISRRTI